MQSRFLRCMLQISKVENRASSSAACFSVPLSLPAVQTVQWKRCVNFVLFCNNLLCSSGSLVWEASIITLSGLYGLLMTFAHKSPRLPGNDTSLTHRAYGWVSAVREPSLVMNFEMHYVMLASQRRVNEHNMPACVHEKLFHESLPRHRCLE